MALTLPYRTLLRRAATTAALGALLVPAASAQAATGTAAKAKKKATPTPVVSSVKPLRLAVGDVLQVRGRNFISGRLKNTVVFQRTGGKAVFVKAEIGTKKLLKVTVPERLAGQLVAKNGAPAATRFRLRVLSRRFGKSFTRDAGSPMIGPKAAPAVGEPGGPDAAAPAPAEGDCDGDTVKNADELDDDADLLDDTTEIGLALDPCKPDSDVDGVTDGYEFRSARDLNDDRYQTPNQYLPYPGKRPYPNPLDGTDAATDFDGDVLTLTEEYKLWRAYGNPAAGLDGLNYSDGLQCSVFGLQVDGYAKQAEFLADAAASGYAQVYHAGGAYSTQPAGLYDVRDVNFDGFLRTEHASNGFARSETRYYDFDRDGLLCDDERDEDADGLTNYDEAHGRLGGEYWSAQYDFEKEFLLVYAGTSIVDADTDGDGVRDGADDQDHDDISNLAELSRHHATGDEPEGVSPRSVQDPDNLPDPAIAFHQQGRVNPFNPCLPNVSSRTCLRHPPFGDSAPAPFDDSPNYAVLN